MYKRFTSTLRKDELPVGAYSAIVYKEGDSVIAEDYKGNRIAEGTSGIDDASVVQSAIDALPTGGKVVLSEDRHHWSSAPTYSNNIVIEGMGSGTIIELDADITPFNLSGVDGCQVSNLSIEVSDGHTAPILRVEGKGSDAKDNKFENIIINNPYSTHNYTGIELVATDKPVFMNQFKFIRMHECNVGINFDVSYESGWINVNYFEDVWVWYFVTALDMEVTGATSYNLGGNEFVNVWGQAGSYSVDGFKVNGSNYFLLSEVVDWGAATSPNYQWHILPGAGSNVIVNRHDNIFAANQWLDEGDNTELINPGVPIAKYRHLRTVSSFTGADYSKLSDAFNDISPSADNQYVLLVFGKIVDDQQIIAKSYTDVIGFNAEIESTVDEQHPVFLNNITNATWRNITVRVTGTKTVSATRAFHLYSCDDTVELINCNGINDAANNIGIGIEISDGNPILKNCKGVSGGDSPTSGINLGNGCYSTLYDCTGIGNDIAESFGITCSIGSSPRLIRCRGIPGKANDSVGFGISHGASPLLSQCTSSPQSFSTEYTYVSGDNGRFRPFLGHPYQITAMMVRVMTANAGVTLDIGTTIGGSEIAAGIDIGSTGYKYIDFSMEQVPADGYIYATPSAAIGDGDVSIYYSVVYNYENNYALLLDYTGNARISNSSFIANGASDAVYIKETTVKNWKMVSCHLETFDPTNKNAVTAPNAMSGVPIYSSTLIGKKTNIIGLADENSGTATITNGNTSVTVAHGLASTPTKVQLTGTHSEVKDAYVSAIDDTNITITVDSAVTADRDVYWSAEV